MEKILVTSALPYANGQIHLGHLAGAYLPADIYVRYQRLRGNDVLYICGTDEHGVPITITAERQGVTPQEIVDKYYQEIKKSFEQFGMSFDHFSRTSLPIHHETAQEFFLKLHDRGLLKRRTIKQLYCENCQRFLPDRYVEGICHHCRKPGAKGDQCEQCGNPIDPTLLDDPKCMLCSSTPIIRETAHWFFPLSDCQPALEEWLSQKHDWKPNVINFCRGAFASGLQDRPITRDLHWGIKVPLEEDKDKVLYVWFDAPIGYISATKEWATKIGQPEKWKDYWCQKDTKLVHFIGKDNIFFHALLFPAMLMEHGGYVLPLNVPANEFLNLEGEKFSTSRNYAVWLPEYLKKFHPDPLRYYLASIAPETRDTDFAWKDFQRRNNNELADILGNFINRALVFAQRYFDGRVPNLNELDENDQQMLRKIKDAPKEIGACLDKFQLREASQKFMDIARAGNIYVDRQKPWDTRKDDISKCQTTINICLQTCKALAVLMHPFMPFSAEKLWNMLNLRGTIEQESWEEAGMPTLEPGHPLNEPEILFPKIEDEVIDAEIAKLSEQQEPGLEILISSEIVDLEYFNKLDIRVANVDSAERIEGTDKLLKLQISIGPEKRIIVAGIGNLYEPEEIIGKRIIVVANLKPVKIKGVLSQGMLLAASLKENIVLLTTEGEIETGAKIV